MRFPGALRAIACLVAFAPLRAQVKVEPWVPAYQGVELASGEAPEPRRQKAFAVRVDLRAPGVRLFATPHAGSKETTSETTGEFLAHHRLQVAINANFYDPCCTPGDKDLLGLAMSGGQVVSPAATHGIGQAALVATRDNFATILKTGPDFRTSGLWTAVAGTEVILADGVRSVAPIPFNKATHPRTAVGLSRDGRYLILLVIDGRQAGYSVGATLDEVVDWLLRFGAADGLNLDGGGSTALVREVEGQPRLVNHPSGVALGSTSNAGGEPQQRSNGNNLGVFARPLPPAA
ncbi:phosphodiester glycosidase family protein [Mesoterricola silvestris]|uniref:Phosphodiester glycosidase domain-containing protein n=1 Tax=Mesoterricola silvestris TaxID=2927979 RepID=A0AA48GY62_9BACT|nr:phosphodiester glycosidase family protein [Mesoterricola silvestris]BDU72523.1 hypothetical protein METEAL_16970 [Mesoterricola silvestris]